MPVYDYKVRDKYGRAITGSMDASAEKEVLDNLKKMGYTPISVEEQKQKPKQKARSIDMVSIFEKASEQDIALFSRQMYTLLNAGVPLLSGLDAVSEQTTSKALKKILSTVRQDVEAGLSFSGALSKHPKAFSSLYVSMVKAGEASGTMDEIMKRLSEFIEYEIEVKSNISSAVRYPILALATLVAAFFVIVLFVIPRFSSFFATFGAELPLPTRILLFIYKLVHDYWLLTGASVAAVVFLFIKFINTPAGRINWDGFKLKVPIVGPLLFKLAMARFAKMTSLLIASGISMIETLDLSANTIGNAVIARAINSIKEGVREGKGVADPMKVSKLFTPIVIQMVSIGEETGKLDELLMNVADHYDQQISYDMKNLTTMIEPILIAALGVMVMFVALGIFLPMWNMVQVVQ